MENEEYLEEDMDVEEEVVEVEESPYGSFGWYLRGF